MSNKPPNIVIPGLNRGAGIPAGYVLGRRTGVGQGPAELLDVKQLGGLGLASSSEVQGAISQAIANLPAGHTSVGIPGIDGLDGEDGISIPGPAGAPGAAGATGATGPQGPPGFGFDGLDGEDAYPIPGTPGAPGAAGAAGATGATGPQGPPGFGMDGTDGEDGASIPGAPGPAGAAGAAGSTGPQGPPGFGMDGLDGEDGASIPGAVGPAGPAGATGPSGAPGQTGLMLAGLDGSDGEDGYPVPGPAGASGSAGSVGPAGPQGPIGFGLDGDIGEDGLVIPGIQGAQGPAGGAQTLFIDFADAGNTGTSETDLYTHTTGASQLAVNGDRLLARWAGTFVNSATATRQVRAYFGGTLCFDTGALTISVSGAEWYLEGTVTRVSSTEVRCAFKLVTEGATLAAYTQYTDITGLTLTGTNILKVTGTSAGTGAATNDIVAKVGSIDYLPVLSGSTSTTRGTSFPSSPAANDQFYRTDRNIQYYYDGGSSQWLSTNLYHLQQVIQDQGSTTPQISTGTLFFTQPFCGLYAIYLQTAVLNTRNTAATPSTNYFTVSFAYENSSAGTSFGSTLSTQNDAQNTFVNRTQVVNQVVASTSKGLFCTKTRINSGSTDILLSFTFRLIG